MSILAALALTIAGTSSIAHANNEAVIQEKFAAASPMISNTEITEIRGLFTCMDSFANGNEFILDFDKGPLSYGATIDNQRLQISASSNGLSLDALGYSIEVRRNNDWPDALVVKKQNFSGIASFFACVATSKN